MAGLDTNAQAQYQPNEPNPALRSLDKLVGTWTMKGRESGPDGEIHGQVAFEWLEGGYFLVQHFDFDHIGKRIKGIEIIGYERNWGQDVPSQDCTSHVFSNTGDAFTYVYDVGDDTLTIWGGERGSPAAFKGKFSDDSNTITGAWEWPGGGYQATLTRVRSG